MSPLLLAVTNAHWDVAAALLDAGADANAHEPGYVALHMVPKVRKPGGGDNDPAPEGSGRLTSLEFVRKLVEHGADVNARMTARPRLNNTRHHEVGSTPFMLAALVADIELMQTLVDLGADVSLTNEEGSTPLMAAAGLGTRSPGEDAGTEREVLEAVQLVLDLGNDIDAVDQNGETAMHGAAYKNLPEGASLPIEGIDARHFQQSHDQRKREIREAHTIEPLELLRNSPDLVEGYTLRVQVLGEIEAMHWLRSHSRPPGDQGNPNPPATGNPGTGR